MLGVLQPSFRPVYEYLFCGSPDRQSPWWQAHPARTSGFRILHILVFHTILSLVVNNLCGNHYSCIKGNFLPNSFLTSHK